jgi:sigma-B regulation protein RsbU (phosphoserine phosphatase)
MLPDAPPAIEGLRIAARSFPAREVGGDFYDFVVSGGDGTASRVGIIVGDVSGKGVSGALLMSAARSTYRVLLDAHPSVVEVMHLANQRLHRDIRKGMFVALVYAVFDPRDRALALQRGADPAHLCRAGGARLRRHRGDSLGILSDTATRRPPVAGR